MYRYYKQEVSCTEGGLLDPQSQDQRRSKSAGWPPSNPYQQPLSDELPPVDNDGLVVQPSKRTYHTRIGPQTGCTKGVQHVRRSGLPFRCPHPVKDAFGDHNSVSVHADTFKATGIAVSAGSNPKVYFNKRTSNFVVVLPDGEMLEGRKFIVFSDIVDNFIL